MSNHLDLVVSTEPGRVAAWTAIEVAKTHSGEDGAPIPWSDADIAAKANDGA